MTHGPDPQTRHPLPGQTRLVFLNTVITNPNIQVGDYTYYDDPDDPTTFERNVLYHFDFVGDRLIIGKFCAIASGVTFIMNGGNHATQGISTYPFGIFGQGWESAMPTAWPHKGDTRIGHDVWIGYQATIMPGVTVGHGAIVGTKSVVTHDVEPYAIVAGNPARRIRKRFTDAEIETLLAVAWWDWPIEKITAHLAVIGGGDVDAIAAIKP